MRIKQLELSPQLLVDHYWSDLSFTSVLRFRTRIKAAQRSVISYLCQKARVCFYSVQMYYKPLVLPVLYVHLLRSTQARINQIQVPTVLAIIRQSQSCAQDKSLNVRENADLTVTNASDIWLPNYGNLHQTFSTPVAHTASYSIPIKCIPVGLTLA